MNSVLTFLKYVNRNQEKTHHKSSDLLSVLLSHFSPFMNLARIKCLSQLVCAMCLKTAFLGQLEVFFLSISKL